MTRLATLSLFLVVLALGCAGAPTAQQSPAKIADDTARKTPPTFADLRYGPHPRNIFDLWLPSSSTPTPLVLYIHGGGFRAGSKEKLAADHLRDFLAAGYAVAAINYRLTDTAPAPAAYLDCARALQFLRHNAAKWNLDPRLVASTGNSAGAGTSMWLAFHDDLADPKSADPIATQSTRLTVVAVREGQSSYDPRFAEAIGIPRPNFERHEFFFPFYGIEPGQIDSPEAYRRYEEAAPITYLTKDDPPALLSYRSHNEEVTSQTKLSVIVHHPRFGIALKERMDALGIEAIVQFPGQTPAEPVRDVDFIRKHFDRARAASM